MAPIPAHIIGHGAQVAGLLNDQDQNNVAHAYLFTGPKHLGKFTVARWFASKLLTQGMDDEAAEQTRDVIARMIHPDVLCLDLLWQEEKMENWDVIARTSNVPQEHRAKKKVKSDTIGIDDVRALQDRLHETGASRYLCCCIRSIERLQEPAANALLKILEEPPPRVVFLLTTEFPHLVLPTLTSRTRVVSFAPLPNAELVALLKDADPDDTAFLLHLAQGAPGKLLTLLKDADLLREEKLLHAQATRFWTANLHERLQWLSGFQAPQVSWDRLLLHLGLALRERCDLPRLSQHHQAYAELISGAETNAHRGLLLERFALAVTPS